MNCCLPLRILLFCLLLAVLAGLSGCSKSVRKVSSASIDETTLYALHDKESSRDQMEQQSPEQLVTSGFVYLARRDFNLANMHFVMALQKDPRMASARTGVARIEQLQGNYAGAVMHYEQALQIEPTSLPALIGWAQSLRLDGKPGEAAEAISRAMNIDPNNLQVLAELATIYDLTGKEALAEPLYREIIERTPRQAMAYNNLGTSYLLRKEYAEAIIQFEQAVQLSPNDKQIRNNLATAYLLHGDSETALEIFKETVGEAAAYNNVGYLLLTQGRLDDAEEALKKALQIHPQFYTRAQENLDTLKRLRRQAASKSR